MGEPIRSSGNGYATTANEGSKRSSKAGIAIVAVLLVAIVAIAIGYVTMSDNDDGPKSYFDIEPLDGTFTLKGSATTDDQMVTYSGTVTFMFDNGKLVDKWMDIKKTEYPDNGVTLKPNTIPRVEFPENYKNNFVPMPGYLSYYESACLANPFLNDMDETNTSRTIYYQGGGLEGQGFKDSNGDKYFISDDGRLVSYCNTDYPVDIYFNLI